MPGVDADAVFFALSDATRRALLEEVAARGSATATQLAAERDITRQAVAKHLAVLADAGLVHGEKAGRETRFTPTPAPMGDAIAWMTGVGGAWDERLRRLERLACRPRPRPAS